MAAAENSAEVLDPTPVEVGNHERPLTLREEMRRFIIQEMSQTAQAHQAESFEEADDFEIEEEPDLSSQYTLQQMAPEEGYPGDDLEGEPTEEDKQAENGQQEPPEEPDGETEGEGVNRKGTPLGKPPSNPEG